MSRMAGTITHNKPLLQKLGFKLFGWYRDPQVNRLNLANDISKKNLTQIIKTIDVVDRADIYEALKFAYDNHCSISFCGTSHTMGGQTIARDGLRLNFKRYNQIIGYDPKNELVTVQPGVTWGELSAYLDPLGKRPHTQQSYCSFSTGGSVGPNCHGVSSKKTLISSIHSFKMIDAQGNTYTCSREENYDLFSEFIDLEGNTQTWSKDEMKKIFSQTPGGYGLLGAIYEITFRVKRNCMTELKVITT